MKQEDIHEAIKEKIKKIASLGSQIEKDFDKEAIHSFRTAIKSLRSFLRFLRMHYDMPGLRMTKKFKLLYHISGSIRDAQLELDAITSKQLALPLYTTKLHQLINNRQQEWRRHYAKKIIKKLKARLTSFKFETLHPVALESFFNLKIAQANTLSMARSPTNTQVHNIRKLVKDILYNIKVSEKKWKAAHKRLQYFPEKKLSHISDLIGEYHDGSVMLQHLKSFSSEKMSPDEKTSVENYCLQEAKRLNAKKKNILTLLKEVKTIDAAY